MSAPADPTDASAPSLLAPPARRLVHTAEGTSSLPFTPGDWCLLAVPSIVWGASFLLIAEGLESYEPGTITWLRVILGFAALALVPGARRTRIDRADWPRVALLGVVWMALPMTMFPLAEQWISSSVTGMLNGSMPLFSAAVAGVLLARLPGRTQLVGLTVGFAGVVAISLPSMQGGSRTALGATLVLVAMGSYGVATNVVVPLQQRYGSVAVIWRSQMVAIALTTPFGLVGLSGSSPELVPTLSIVVLGAVGTGFAFIAAGMLMGRVGATRGSVLAYLIPVVALVLGVAVRAETVEPVAVAGLGLVLVGAWLVTRAGR